MYNLNLTKKAQNFYQMADISLVDRLNRCFEQICQNPYDHPNIKKLYGVFAGSWRYRLGNWRIVYRVDESTKTIIILLIGKRGSVYG